MFMSCVVLEKLSFTFCTESFSLVCSGSSNLVLILWLATWLMWYFLTLCLVHMLCMCVCVETDENNLNKPSLRDSQTFSQNISSQSKNTGVKDVPDVTKPSEKPTTDKQATEDKNDVSMEDVGRILNEAAQV